MLLKPSCQAFSESKSKHNQKNSKIFLILGYMANSEYVIDDSIQCQLGFGINAPKLQCENCQPKRRFQDLWVRTWWTPENDMFCWIFYTTTKTEKAIKKLSLQQMLWTTKFHQQLLCIQNSIKAFTQSQEVLVLQFANGLGSPRFPWMWTLDIW